MESLITEMHDADFHGNFLEDIFWTLSAIVCSNRNSFSNAMTGKELN